MCLGDEGFNLSVELCRKDRFLEDLCASAMKASIFRWNFAEKIFWKRRERRCDGILSGQTRRCFGDPLHPYKAIGSPILIIVIYSIIPVSNRRHISKRENLSSKAATSSF